jgi:hypothetical protein
MVSTVITNPAMSVAALQDKTDAAGAPLVDLAGEELRLFSALVNPGVFGTLHYSVTPGGGMTVDVGSGAAKTDIAAVAGSVTGQGNYFARLDVGSVNLPVPAADLTNERIDEIYVVVSDNLYDFDGFTLGRIGYRSGDPAAGPSAPGPDPSWVAFYLLATITVPSGLGSIGVGNIADERSLASLSIDATDPAALDLLGTRQMQGDLDMGGNQIVDLDDGSQPAHAVTKAQLDALESTGSANFLPIDANAVSASRWLSTRTLSAGGDASGSVGVNGTANFTLPLTVNQASKWRTARSIILGGDASGSVSIDGSSNKTLVVTVLNDSHTHDTRYVRITGGEFTGRVTFIRGGAASSRALQFEGTTTGLYYRTTGNAGIGFAIGAGAAGDYVMTTSGFSPLPAGFDLGSASAPWDNITYTGALIDLSDPSTKKNIRPISSELPEGGALGVVMATEPIAYDVKAKSPGKGFKTRKMIGLDSVKLREATGGPGTWKAHEKDGDTGEQSELTFIVDNEVHTISWEAIRELGARVASLEEALATTKKGQ